MVASSVAVQMQASCEASDELYARELQSWGYAMDIPLVSFRVNYYVTI